MRKPPQIIALLAAGVLLLSLPGLTGCMYSTSRGRVDDNIKRVFVQYLENLTSEPQIGVEISDDITTAIQIDNTLRVVSEGEADAIISGQVTRYHLRPMAARPEDLTINEYQIQIAVTLTFTVRATGETLFQARRFTGKGSYVLNDPTGQTTEESAREEAVLEILRDILGIVVEDW